MKDLYNNIEAVSLLGPIAVSTTQTITDIDLAGFNSACLLISVGLNANFDDSNKWVFTLKHGDDGTTYANVETDDMLDLTVASGVVLTIDAATKDNTLYKIGYVGGKRYLELTCTVTGNIEAPLSIVLIKGDPEIAPVA